MLVVDLLTLDTVHKVGNIIPLVSMTVAESWEYLFTEIKEYINASDNIPFNCVYIPVTQVWNSIL